MLSRGLQVYRVYTIYVVRKVFSNEASGILMAGGNGFVVNLYDEPFSYLRVDFLKHFFY